MAHVEVQRLTASVAEGEIQAIAAASERLNDRLLLLDADSRISVRSLLRENFPEDQWDRFDALPETLAAIDAACAAVLENFGDHVQGNPGRPEHPGFRRFIDRLAAFFENAGGRVSAAYSETYPVEARRRTPFVRFCWSVYENVPPIPGVPVIGSESAFGEAVHSALEKGK
ncbi:hypothetical protein [Devosia sp.]|uniref:hypothetical protein n=1 Tax=Devosia sp. TaxID=1871048 RepID=UPI00260DCA2F|nr:hypothetical protein [Devosia sp.]